MNKNHNYPVVSVEVEQEKTLTVDVNFKEKDLIDIDMEDVSYYSDEEDDNVDEGLIDKALVLNGKYNWVLMQDKFGTTILVAPKKSLTPVATKPKK